MGIKQKKQKAKKAHKAHLQALVKAAINRERKRINQSNKPALIKEIEIASIAIDYYARIKVAFGKRLADHGVASALASINEINNAIENAISVVESEKTHDT